MAASLVLGFAIAFQLAAAALALWQIRRTGAVFAWACISAALALMALRRGITLYYSWDSESGTAPVLSAELVALATSLLMFMGIVYVGTLFRQFQAAQEALRQEMNQREVAEQALKESEERYRNLVELAPDGIYVNVDGRFVFANSAAARILGAIPETLMGTEILSTVQPDYRESVTAATIKVLEEGKPLPPSERKLIRTDGTCVDVEVCTGPITYQGRQGIQAVLRDITDRKRAEELVLQTERLKAVADLATGVAHNFNNLLQIVLSASQLAVKRLKTGRVDDACSGMDHIVQCAQMGSEMVKSLQSFAGLRADRGPGHTELFDASEPVRLAVSMSAPWLEDSQDKQGAPLTIQTDLQDGCTIRGARNEIVEVMLNLIRNSVEAVQEQGGGPIKVGTSVQGESVVMSVADSGAGIPSDIVGKVFEPFLTTKGFQRAGLGLSCSYGIVVRHGGNMEVNSTEGAGTTVTVTLPLAKA